MNPIILPKGLAAERLTLKVHRLNMHASQKSVFSTMRQKYWVLGGFSYVKNLVRKLCKTPRCRYIQCCSPKMSPLPEIRLDKPEAWTNVGVDYMGPIQCKHLCVEDHAASKYCPHPKSKKVWVALFTCLHSRAMHGEVVLDCTTREFLNAFRAFVANKGRPSCFYSDNAQMFKSADKQLHQLLKTDMKKVYNNTFSGTAPIQWLFSTEMAPWTNGVTERLIGIFKKQLTIVMQKQTCAVAELKLTVAEVTSHVNERPLGKTSEDADDAPITPNLLATGKHHHPLVTPSTAVLSTMPFDKMWIERKKTLNLFWEKWQADYLTTLSIDRKWPGDNIMVKPGDVVILCPESLEKNQWRMARIINIHKDLDGVATTATVRLPNTRTLRQLALLEPAALELERQMAAKDQSPTCGRPQRRSVWNDTEHVESDSQGASDSRERSRSRSVSRPYPTEGEPIEEDEHPGEAAATAADPVATETTIPPARAQLRTGNVRQTRPRHRKGFYKALNKGL